MRRHLGRVFAGTDIGVFFLDPSMPTWVPLANGMPPVLVTSFTTTADGRLLASTYGRGVYELAMDEAPFISDPRRRAVHH